MLREKRTIGSIVDGTLQFPPGAVRPFFSSKRLGRPKRVHDKMINSRKIINVLG